MAKKRDIYQEVTDRIVEALENGTNPWRKPWKGSGLPRNAATGRQYQGINVFLLWMQSLRKGYSSNQWMTFKQAQSLEANVAKGEKGTLITLFRPVERPVFDEHEKPVIDEKTGKQKMNIIPIIRGFNVFNIDQIENLPDGMRIDTTPEWSDVEEAEHIVSRSTAKVVHGADSAYFAPRLDTIYMPKKTAFNGKVGYYSTLLHELTHWTGHESRLARDFSGRFGDESYAFEELIAEMGSAFLFAHCDIEPDMQHASYIDGWLKVLKRDKRAVFTAARKAQEATDFLLKKAGRQNQAEDEEAA